MGRLLIANDMDKELCYTRISVSMKVIGSVITNRDSVSNNFQTVVLIMGNISMEGQRV